MDELRVLPQKSGVNPPLCWYSWDGGTGQCVGRCCSMKHIFPAEIILDPTLMLQGQF